MHKHYHKGTDVEDLMRLHFKIGQINLKVIEQTNKVMLVLMFKNIPSTSYYPIQQCNISVHGKFFRKVPFFDNSFVQPEVFHYVREVCVVAY